jgi:hypothetical protein
MRSPATFSVRRAGRTTRRRQNAKATAASVTTATAFCIALTAVHRAPSNGISMIACTRPPVTAFAVPMVSSTKPQKIAKCIRPAGRSRNIRVWTRP